MSEMILLQDPDCQFAFLQDLVSSENSSADLSAKEEHVLCYLPFRGKSVLPIFIFVQNKAVFRGLF